MKDLYLTTLRPSLHIKKQQQNPQENGVRKATLVKCPVRASGVAVFRICDSGVRDNRPPTDSQTHKRQKV